MEIHKLTIAKDGSVTIEVNGIKGKSCQDATRELEKRLGAVTDDQQTGEYYEEENANFNLN